MPYIQYIDLLQDMNKILEGRTETLSRNILDQLFFFLVMIINAQHQLNLGLGYNIKWLK